MQSTKDESQYPNRGGGFLRLHHSRHVNHHLHHGHHEDGHYVLNHLTNQHLTTVNFNSYSTREDLNSQNDLQIVPQTSSLIGSKLQRDDAISADW